MTRVFVYEYTCAAPSISDGAASLRAEGEAMLRAVLADFRRVPGVEAFTILAEPDEEAAFRAAARSADWSLVIAPEFHDILLTRCRWVQQEGGRLLGPSPAAVKLCADKLALYQSLGRHGIHMPETRAAMRGIAAGWAGPFVRKPRFGAGSVDTSLVDPRSDSPPHESPLGEMIEQAFVPGLAVGVSFLTGPKDGIGLIPCEQRLSADGRFRYLGGRLPLPPDLAKRAQNLAKWTIQYLPNVHGWIGVDLVLGDRVGGDWVIEINPRLTTSYIGLRELSETNLTEVMLSLAEGAEPPPISWRPGTVEFTSDGSARYTSPHF